MHLVFMRVYINWLDSFADNEEVLGSSPSTRTNEIIRRVTRSGDLTSFTPKDLQRRFESCRVDQVA